ELTRAQVRDEARRVARLFSDARRCLGGDQSPALTCQRLPHQHDLLKARRDILVDCRGLALADFAQLGISTRVARAGARRDWELFDHRLELRIAQLRHRPARLLLLLGCCGLLRDRWWQLALLAPLTLALEGLLQRRQTVLDRKRSAFLVLGVRLPAAVVIVRWRHHVPVRSPDGVFVDPLPQAIDFALFFATRPG